MAFCMKGISFFFCASGIFPISGIFAVLMPIFFRSSMYLLWMSGTFFAAPPLAGAGVAAAPLDAGGVVAPDVVSGAGVVPVPVPAGGVSPVGGVSCVPL